MLLIAGPAVAAALDLSELDRRIDLQGAESVSAELRTSGAAEFKELQARTADCQLGAVGLSVRLSRSAKGVDSAPYVESLRAAAGKCARFLLAVVYASEVPRVCGSLETWTPAQMARELRRRMAALEADPLLRASTFGKACHAAYWHELTHTRVALKRKA